MGAVLVGLAALVWFKTQANGPAPLPVDPTAGLKSWQVVKVAELWSDEVGLINGAMVMTGMACVYERYVGGCPSREAIEGSQDTAQEYGCGIWGQADLQKLWDYRRL
ncbi:MAG: hypothetical protein HC771_01475 [Synechococcales cyanobacterium CRU_2_2]|nr:hypothetical protein [Synechococcales cyanobacterium CRU_2_2]